MHHVRQSAGHIQRAPHRYLAGCFRQDEVATERVGELDRGSRQQQAGEEMLADRGVADGGFGLERQIMREIGEAAGNLGLDALIVEQHDRAARAVLGGPILRDAARGGCSGVPIHAGNPDSPGSSPPAAE